MLLKIKEKHFPQNMQNLKFSTKVGRKSKTTNLLNKTHDEYLTAKILGHANTDMLKHYEQVKAEDRDCSLNCVY